MSEASGETKPEKRDREEAAAAAEEHVKDADGPAAKRIKPKAARAHDRRIQVNDKFAQTEDLRIAAQRSFMIDGRTVWADERGSGSKSKLYRCSGASFDTKANGDLRKVTKGCSALIRACKQLVTNEWKVTKANYDHQNCAGGTKKPSMRALLPEATAIVENSSTITTPALGETLKATIACGEISGRTLNRLRRVIRNGGNEHKSESYRRLADYLKQLRSTSGGTITDCQFDKDGSFQRCFLMLGGAAYFATKGVQKVYSIDAAHLKGSWNGVILALSFKNSNNNVVHVATAVCPKENADAYTYLLRNAMRFEPMKEVLNNASYTFFSDGHKGLGLALPALCPLTEGRLCLQHVLKNIPVVGKDEMVLAYEASKAPTESLFHASMDKLKANKEASWKGLNGTPHKLWANYADRGNMTWNQSTSNMSETVNSMIGAETRAKPVMLMLQDIVLKTANRMATAACVSGDDSSVVSFAQESYDTELQWSNGLQVTSCGQGRFFVFSAGDQMRGNSVHLRLGDTALFPPACTCGFFERFGIACRHLITVGRYLEKPTEVFDLINPGYRLRHYRHAASDPRYPIEPPAWDRLESNPTHHAPLRVDGQARRPNKRKASNGEIHTSSRYNGVQPAHDSSLSQDTSLSESGSSEAPIDVGL